MSDEYQIQTHVVPVEVSLGDGPHLVGHMFLRPHTAGHAGPETVADRLNDRTAFFPVRAAAPEPALLLVGKAQVRYVIAPDSGTIERVAFRRAAAVQIGASIMLDDGEVVSGIVFLDGVPGQVRPLDYLNAIEDPFVTLVRPDQEYLINRTRIRYFVDITS
ncbi:MAG TPA: hypothetical protein VF406_02935 [Thermodesulfobacteriota bacterium]